MRLLLLFCICLFPALAVAQITISGRVLDAKTKFGLPGVTVLQTGTTNETSSNAEGKFEFTVAGQPDSVAITISSIGYFSQHLRVAAGSSVMVRLKLDIEPPPDYHFLQPRFRVSFISGLRYAPIGAALLLEGSRFIRVPVTASVSYQTNFAHNHVLNVGLGLPPIRHLHTLNFTENLEYQHLRAPVAGTWASSCIGIVGVNAGHIGRTWLPTFLLGAGYMRWRPQITDALSLNTGCGYSFGLRFSVLPKKFNIYGTVQATHWPDCWQWQGRLVHNLPHQLQAGVALNQLRNYTEVSVLLTRNFN